jgi:6-phosphogluconate dehydrogenase
MPLDQFNKNQNEHAHSELAIVGLGKMGGNLARQALSKGLRVVGISAGKIDQDLLDSKLILASDYNSLIDLLSPPRQILLYVPAGEIVDQVIRKLATILQPGDIIIDGGNSYWGDSIRRYHDLKLRNINFIDMGTSGGPKGALTGACFMIGGEENVRDQIKPLLHQLSISGGLISVGPPGSGHFVKLVHNGIEFGIMQAIGEGLDLLENYKEKLNIENILEGWRHGTVIRSWLLDLLTKAYSETNGLSGIQGYVEDTGEVNWLVSDALEMEVSIPVIAQSVWKLIDSRNENRIWAKAIAAMRHGFGGHPYGPDANIASYRHTSRTHPNPNV